MQNAIYFFFSLYVFQKPKDIQRRGTFGLAQTLAHLILGSPRPVCPTRTHFQTRSWALNAKTLHKSQVQTLQSSIHFLSRYVESIELKFKSSTLENPNWRHQQQQWQLQLVLQQEAGEGDTEPVLQDQSARGPCHQPHIGAWRVAPPGQQAPSRRAPPHHPRLPPPQALLSCSPSSFSLLCSLILFCREDCDLIGVVECSVKLIIGVATFWICIYRGICWGNCWVKLWIVLLDTDEERILTYSKLTQGGDDPSRGNCVTTMFTR